MTMEHYIIGFLLMLCPYTLGWSNTTTFPNITYSTSVSSSSGYYYYVGVSPSNVSCSDAKSGFPSLTLVMDTTGSMSSYMYQFQDVVRTLSNRLAASSANATRQYTLMEFNDPTVGPLRVTCSSTEFFNSVYNLYSHDGGDCPEYAMAGLLKALEVSPYGSLAVLVTDASAKDYSDTYTVNRIYSLLDSLQVKIFFFAGYCDSVNASDFQIYKNIAARSYGHVFQINYSTSKIADLLNFFLKIPVNSTTRLLSVDSGSYYYRNSFWVPTNLTSLILSLSGITNSSITLYQPSGAVANLTTYFTDSWGSVFYSQYPSYGTWTIEVYASGSYSIRIEGYKDKGVSSGTFNTTAFCSRCSSIAICKKDLLDYTCVCREGFSGDGFSCYDVNECDYSRWPNPCNAGYCVNTYGSYNCICPSGYAWQNKTCVDIDECSAPELNSCDPLAVCNNYIGSYSCYCPAGYYGNGYKCEIDECTKDICGFGRECIKSNGSHTCSDPCFNYTTLNEPTRSTSYYNYYYYYYYYYSSSDYYLNGWYRFMGSGGIRMPEFCPSTGSCYTRYPMWLDGTHPQPADGFVNRTVCISDTGICCQWRTNVTIKACPGGFHIYKFSSSPVYYSRYCTDPATVPEYCSCTDDEECRAVGGRYSCHCKNDDTITALADIRPVLSCGDQEIKASFQKCQLEKFNLDPSRIHLKDSSCKGFNDFNVTNIISVVSLLKKGVCGNELVSNGSSVIYKNRIYLSLDTNSSLGGEDALSIGISCVYPLDMQLSLETALYPFAGSASVEMEGAGILKVTMALYKDSAYTSPYEGTEVILTSTTNVFIGIRLITGDVSQYELLITDCYAAASNTSTKYDIIKSSCPSKQDSTINVIQNGGSVNGQFSVQLFGYVKDASVVYLYCSVHICTSNCTPTCTGVRALTATDSVKSDTTLILGPIKRQADSSASTPNIGGGAYSKVASLATTLLFLAGTFLFLIL